MPFKKFLFCAIRVTVSSKPGIQHIHVTPEMKCLKFKIRMSKSVCGNILALAFLSVAMCHGSHINRCI